MLEKGEPNEDNNEQRDGDKKEREKLNDTGEEQEEEKIAKTIKIKKREIGKVKIKRKVIRRKREKG